MCSNYYPRRARDSLSQHEEVMTLSSSKKVDYHRPRPSFALLDVMFPHWVRRVSRLEMSYYLRFSLVR